MSIKFSCWKGKVQEKKLLTDQDGAQKSTQDTCEFPACKPELHLAPDDDSEERCALVECPPEEDPGVGRDGLRPVAHDDLLSIVQHCCMRLMKKADLPS